MQQLPIVLPGQRVVAKSDGKGRLVLTVETVMGREFLASEDISGYLLAARLQMDILGTLTLPPSWYKVWCKLLAGQDPTRKAVVRGYIPITQRGLQEGCRLSSPSVSEATQFWMHIGWMRNARRGLVQLNPWLNVAGTSSEQKQWQEEWIDAGGPVCVIPDDDFIAAWRDERAQVKAEAKAAREAVRKTQKVVPLTRRPKPPGRRKAASA
ncbi:hypothetical protein [Streptomyces sp. NPDC020141]|uniref:hypothetical protein n=1 Tax=Streptomyces sp. NPDC020141 TaxID=3365065 RepID=UPI0037993EA0